MAGYIRQSTFVDGDTITAALFNNEYNQLVNAFSNTSGHKHDGTTAEGPVIGLIGDAGETSPNNKVLIDTTNNYIEFYVEVSSAPVQQLYIADGAIIPVTDSDIDLGTTSLRFKDTYTDTVTTTGNVSIGGDLTVTGSATISGNLTFGDADTDSINLAAEIDSDIIPNTDGTYDLGSATKEWQDLYIDGTANIDSLVADTADINGGTIDGVTIGGTAAGAVTFTDLSDGTITIAGFADEDNMSSNSATLLPTQQSVKAYVDSQVTAQDLDFQGDTGGALSIDLDSESLTIAGGTGLDTVGSGNTVTVNIDSTVATLTGTQTLTNKTLTSPDVNTPDIDGGTIDGTVIGGTTTAAGSFTTLQADTSLNVDGTLTTDGLTVVGSGSNIRYDVSSSNPHTNPTLHLENQNATDGNVAALMLSADNANGVGGSAYIYAQSETTNQKGNLVFAREDGANTPVTSMKLSSNGDISFYEDTGTTVKLFWDASAESLGIGTASVDAELHISGSGNDAKIILEGAANPRGNYIACEGADNLVIAADEDNLGADSEIQFKVDTSQKMAINSSGIDVTGTVTSDGLTVDGDATISDSTNPTLTITDTTTPTSLVFTAGNLSTTIGTTTDHLLKFETNNTERLRIQNNGDISFYEDTGTTAKLFWDASAESLGIGTSSPAEELHISTGSPVIRLEDTDGGYSGISGSNGNVRLRADEGNTQASSFVSFEIDTAEEMRLTSTGLGIGTTNPDTKLHLSGADNEAVVRLENSSTGLSEGDVIGALEFYKSDSSGAGVGVSGSLKAVSGNVSGAETDLIFGTSSTARGNNAETMRLTGEGSVGLAGATTIDDGDLQIGDANSAFNIALAGPRTKFGYDGSNAIVQGGVTKGIAFCVDSDTLGSGEAGRFDISGNLLVGTTSAVIANSSSNVGTAIGAGLIESARAGVVAQFNRHTSDGSILDFQKDGTTVGSIGTKVGGLTIGNGDTALRMQDSIDSIYPFNITADSNRDAAIDLGSTGARFKDLYLSGGAFIGGTGAANKLDDYEEGTWTPVLVDTSGNTTSWAGFAQGHYTKVGNTVTVWYAFSSSTTAITSRAYQAIQGLPFTNNIAEGASICTLSRVFDFTFNDEDFYTRAVGTEIQFAQLGSGNAATTLTPTSNQQRLAGGAVYQVA